MKNEELSPYDSFFSKLRIINPLAKGYNDFEKLTTSGLSTEQAVCKLRLEKIPPAGDKKNYAYLWSIWVSEGMISFTDFLMWYRTKKVVPTLETMQKRIELYQQTGIDLLKLG